MNRMVDAMEAERTYRAEKEKVERESMRGGRGSDGRSPSTISISRSPGESGFTPGRFSTGETATDSPSGAVVHVSNQRGDMQYLGLSSLISISSEAESLIADRLRGSAGASPQVGGGVRVDDAETAGALRKLNLVRSKLGNLFPQYGHQKLRSAAMDAATMDIPSRSEADRLVKVYFDKVHNWFPLYDRAKFENEIGRFYEDPETLGKDRGWMACFYNILLFGRWYIEHGKGRTNVLQGYTIKWLLCQARRRRRRPRGRRFRIEYGSTFTTRGRLLMILTSSSVHGCGTFKLYYQG